MDTVEACWNDLFRYASDDLYKEIRVLNQNVQELQSYCNSLAEKVSCLERTQMRL